MQDKYKKLLDLQETENFFAEQKASVDRSLREVRVEISNIQAEIVQHFKQNGMISDEYQEGNIKLAFSLTKPRGKMVIDDPEALPEEYVSYEPKVDKKGLGEFLKGKNLMEYGVSYEYSEPSVTYRVVK